VTVIATGFGGARRRRPRREAAAIPVPGEPRPAPVEAFDVSEEDLQVPSFLRDD
jgi:hypothetical protein